VIALPRFPTTGQIEVGMHEDDSDADFYFKVGHHLVPDHRFVHFDRSLDLAHGRQVTFDVERPPGDMVFVLAGFQLAFHTGDHHLDEAGIFESNGSVTVRFNDKNDDDTFKFSLRYFYAPRDAFSALGTARGDHARGAARAAIPNGQAVLRGFNMNFRSQDHHIRDLGALLTGDGRAEVFFEDKNGDDEFDWSLGWAVLK
jgi:hypothetical protein